MVLANVNQDWNSQSDHWWLLNNLTTPTSSNYSLTNLYSKFICSLTPYHILQLFMMSYNDGNGAVKFFLSSGSHWKSCCNSSSLVGWGNDNINNVAGLSCCRSSTLDKASATKFSQSLLYSTWNIYPINLATHICCDEVPNFCSSRNFRDYLLVLIKKGFPIK